MSIHRPFTISDAAPIDQQTALDGIAAGCAAGPTPLRDRICSDGFSAICLTIVRFVSAAYTTGDAACWEAALQLSDEALDAEHGPLLVARLTTLIRILRRSGKQEFVSLPATCNRMTVEEQRLMLTIEAARRKNQVGLVRTVSELVDDHDCRITMRAADLVADLSHAPCAAHLREQAAPSRSARATPLARQLDCLGCPASPLAKSPQNSCR